MSKGEAQRKKTAHAESNPHSVKVGQTWADNDPRMMGRTLVVSRIEGAYAYCQQRNQSRLVRIRLDRFRPNSTGFVLVKDVQP